MQNIRKTIKSIDMKKIKKYVVFKYEDEFGFHYMVMDNCLSPSRMWRGLITLMVGFFDK